jgi:hypothetical protein
MRRSASAGGLEWIERDADNLPKGESSTPPCLRGHAIAMYNRRPADLVTELDGTPVRDAADLQLRLALLKDRRSRRIRHVAPRRRGDGARREEREPAARYSSRNQASRNTSA